MYYTQKGALQQKLCNCKVIQTQFNYNIIFWNNNKTAALEKGGQVNTIYADFEKAFDQVPHHLLLKKLHSYNLNVHVIQWIRSFLCYPVIENKELK